MRCVLAPAIAGPPPPDRSQVDAMRHLGSRFFRARVREVPLLRAAELDSRADSHGTTRVWLALEALQVTGSFHVRGALVALDAVSRAGGEHVVAPSAGNHGVAVAYAACTLGLSATIVVPRTVSRTKRERIERYGAELVVASCDRYETAEALAREIAFTQGASYIAPADGVDVVLGNGASLGLEIVRGLGGIPDKVLVPLGDGGLAIGLGWAFAAEGADPFDRNVWGVQPEARCETGAWLAGTPPAGREIDAPTLAEELGPGLSSEVTNQAIGAVAGALVVSEGQIAAAMAHAYRDMGLVLEGSAAVALAPLLFGLPDDLRGGDLVAILTGRNVDPEKLDAVVAQCGQGGGALSASMRPSLVPRDRSRSDRN